MEHCGGELHEAMYSSRSVGEQSLLGSDANGTMVLAPPRKKMKCPNFLSCMGLLAAMSLLASLGYLHLRLDAQHRRHEEEHLKAMFGHRLSSNNEHRGGQEAGVMRPLPHLSQERENPGMNNCVMSFLWPAILMI
eukprot:5319396-Amphidinium_carterae.1